MELLTPRGLAPRWWLLAGGGLLGVFGSFLGPGPVGCIYPDTCIKVTSPGHDWCRNLANALQWPIGGSIEDAEPVLDPEGNTPQGCRCFNDAEHQILEDEVPACRYERLLDEIEQAARERCQSLVLPGYDHNCWTIAGPEASLAEPKFPDGSGRCIGNCEYGGPPSGGECPDPTPYECATSDGGDEGCEPPGDTTSSSADGDGSAGTMLRLEDAIHCDGYACEIDETFARQLLDDPSRLVGEGTQLVYDEASRRHVFMAVHPGSIVHTLGLRTGDRLEHVGGWVIDSLDAALQAYADLRDTNPIELRVRRGTQWVDFTYTFVP